MLGVSTWSLLVEQTRSLPKYCAMNRDIKFKARAIKFIEVSSGGSIPVGEWITWYPLSWVPSWTAFIDVETIRQYTGLKDKNGLEIYEGDVLLREWDGLSQNKQPPEGYVHVYDYFTVEWKNQGFNFRERRVEIQNFNGKPWYTSEYDNPMTFHNWMNKKPEIETLEVIGNRYENPELIE